VTTRVALEEGLRTLEDGVVELASMVDKAISRSVEALKRLDQEEAKRIVHEDLLINKKRFDIEEQAIELIATQQPMARDLRRIIAILNIIVDLERMADHAEGIAKIVLMHQDKPLLKPLIDIPRMAEKAPDNSSGARQDGFHGQLQAVQGGPGIAPGDFGQVGQGLLGDFHRPVAIAPFRVGQGPTQDG